MSHLRRFRQTRWGILLLIASAYYYIPWCFAWQIGLVKPRANLRYYFFSENKSIDICLYSLYWPMIRLSEAFETTHWGAHYAIYYRKRGFPTAKDMNGL